MQIDLSSIDTAALGNLPVPVEILLSEAEYLFQISLREKALFCSAGIPEASFEIFPLAIDTLRSAEWTWTSRRIGLTDARHQWREQKPKAYALRDELLRTARFALRHAPKPLLDDIARGKTHADMLLDLGKLAQFGQSHREELARVGCDPQRFEEAARLGKRLSKLYATATEHNEKCPPEKQERDRAYLYLQKMMRDFRETGKFLFWKDEKKKRLFVSKYKQTMNRNYRVERENN